MGQLYRIPFVAVAQTAVQDLLEISIPSTCAAKLHELHWSQETEAGDSQSEQLRFSLKIYTGALTSGSGGAAVTPKAIHPSGATARLTAEAGNTTRSSGGTVAQEIPLNANVLGPGLHVLFIPEHRPEAGPSSFIVFGLEKTPLDSITASGWAIVEEVG